MIGDLTVIAGPMFSGKTSQLLHFYEMYEIGNKQTILFKPKKDNRYSNNDVVTHSGKSIESVVVDKSKDIYNHIKDETDAIFLDEIHFFDDYLVDVSKDILDKGKDVFASGLDMSFKRNPFYNTANLMAMANEVIKTKAVCSYCGEYDAIYSINLTDDADEKRVGGAESYKVACPKCYRKN